MARPLTPSGGRPPKKLMECILWLTEFTLRGDQPEFKIKAQGTAKGFSDCTIDRAKKRVGLHSIPKGYPRVWYWSPNPQIVKQVAKQVRALTEQDVIAGVAKQVKSALTTVDAPWSQKNIEKAACEEFFNFPTPTFDALLATVIEMTRSYDNPDLMEPYTDDQIREFVGTGLSALYGDMEEAKQAAQRAENGRDREGQWGMPKQQRDLLSEYIKLAEAPPPASDDLTF